MLLPAPFSPQSAWHDPAATSKVTLWFDRGGQLVAVDGAGGASRFAYDAAGRLVAEQRPDGGHRRLRYDAAHRLVSVTGPEPGG